MENKLLLIGGGGHCHSVIDSVLSAGSYTEIGVVAKDRDNYNELKKDDYIAPYLIGTDGDLQHLYEKGWGSAFITLGSIGNTKGRRMLSSVIAGIGFELPVIADLSAIVSNKAEIAPGVFIGKRAIVNAGCKIGVDAIINTGAILEHDCLIGDFVHVSPGAILCGQVSVGNDSHIGAGSVVRQGIRIGISSLVGVGSVVVRDIPDKVMAFGNPCRVVE